MKKGGNGSLGGGKKKTAEKQGGAREITLDHLTAMEVEPK